MSDFDKRPSDYLKKQKGSSAPTRLLFFDTETHIKKRSDGFIEFPMRLGFAIYVELDKNLNIIKRVEHEFYDTIGFVDLLERYSVSKKKLNIYAHNVGFDIAVLGLPLKFIEKKYTSEPPIINMRVFIWDVQINEMKVTFLDTANYGVHSVEQLGDDLSIPKMKIDFDKCTDAELMEYCKNDVLIIERFVIDFITFIHENELGSFKSTLASQALHTYRTTFYNENIYNHNEPDILMLERDSYHGGRVEATKICEIHNVRHYKLDVNSMYPSIMRDCYMPTCWLNKYNKLTLKSLKENLRKYYVIAEVQLKTDKPVYPVRNEKIVKYPYKNILDNPNYNPNIPQNLLYFPTGEFTTTLHHAELEYALEHNHIISIGKTAIYKKEIVFRDFIDYMYNERLKHTKLGHKSWRLIIKLLMNSLYGKFGQLSVTREHIGYAGYNEIKREYGYIAPTNEKVLELTWCGNIYHERTEGETPHSNPAIAGAITAYARMLIWKYAEMAEIDNVVYIDTDSIIVNYPGYLNVIDYIDETKLGYLKNEGETLYIKIRGAKDYDFDVDEKIKGITKKAIQLYENKFELLLFQGFIDWFNNGCIDLPKAKVTIKELKRKYNKGLVQDTGKIIPHNLAQNVLDNLV